MLVAQLVIIDSKKKLKLCCAEPCRVAGVADRLCVTENRSDPYFRLFPLFPGAGGDLPLVSLDCVNATAVLANSEHASYPDVDRNADRIQHVDSPAQ